MYLKRYLCILKELLKRGFLSEGSKLSTNKLALRISTCSGKTWNLFYIHSQCFGSPPPLLSTRPSHIPPKQNLSFFAGSLLPAPPPPGDHLLRESDWGGPTLFRSCFSNFLFHSVGHNFSFSFRSRAKNEVSYPLYGVQNEILCPL